MTEPNALILFLTIIMVALNVAGLIALRHFSKLAEATETEAEELRSEVDRLTGINNILNRKLEDLTNEL